jgi:hypothetical protein
MRTGHIITVVCLALVLTPVFSQLQGSKWFFGYNAGVDFSSGTPQNIPGGQTGSDVSTTGEQEGTSAISDSQGHLLFYTGGKTVWNRFHKVMANGAGLMGGNSSTQAALIIPFPGSDSMFCIVTSDQFQSFYNPPSRGYRYHVVDVCAHNDSGAVVLKNILLKDSSTEKIAACADAAGTGYWILGHKMYSDEFLAWHLTSAGITSTVSAHIGAIHGWSASQSLWVTGAAQGQMKISPLKNKIALVVGNFLPAYLELFDFNPATGVVSNPCHIVIDAASYQSVYGVEFSPDGTKVYVTGQPGNANRLYQFDISSGGGACPAIISSSVSMNLAPNYQMFGAQTAPNGKIYLTVFSQSTVSYLAQITFPNVAGVSCSVVPNFLALTGGAFYMPSQFVAGFAYGNGVPGCCADCMSAIEEPAPGRFAVAVDGSVMSIDGELYGNAHLFDVYGRLLRSATCNGHCAEIELNGIAPGVYLIRIESSRIYAPRRILINEQ